MRVLFVAPLWKGSTSRYRVDAFHQLGHQVVEVDTTPADRSREMSPFSRVMNRLGRPRDLAGANRQLLEATRELRFDLLWVEKGRTIAPRTLEAFRAAQPGARVVAYSPDDMLFRPNQSAAYLAGIPVYDLHVTTKRHHVRGLARLGARDVCFVDNAYDPATHRPLELTPAERARWGSEVVFVGRWERNRIERVVALCEAGVEVTVHGPGWSREAHAHPRLRVGEPWVTDQDYTRAVCGARISLGFLSRLFPDQQTTRTVEIPAAGGFMLADRTAEHLELFRDGEEAVFFGETGELVEKAVYYLEHDDERRRIAAAGRERCLRDGYSYASRIRTALEHLDGRRAPVRPSAGVLAR